MAEKSIPVDLFNPGQVFACMGFLEVAEVLAGDAEGRFDWSNEGNVRFLLRAAGEENPFGRVLDFLAHARIRRVAPPGYEDPPPKKRSSASDKDADKSPGSDQPIISNAFPSPTADTRALPIRLLGVDSGRTRQIDIGHWTDASTRNEFKLYAGNRSAAGIARAMLAGTREKPKKGHSEGDVRTLGLNALWIEHGSELEVNPFGMFTPIGGSFNFDPRGAWTGIDAGYSPDQQGHQVDASPVVELLAAIGLEHARPYEYETRQVRYAAWGSLLPAMLARAALGGVDVGVPTRTFLFELGGTKHNKVVTFAEEEART